MGTRFTFLAGAVAGAAAAYFLDPQGGARRRHETRDRTLSTVKSGAGDFAGTAKQAADRARGAVHTVTPSMPGRGEAADDVTLARRVETEIFRPADAPKGSVSVNAENGVVFLRGVVEDRETIERLGAGTQKVDGVKEVRNLLHLPGTEAPVAPATR
jgi:osmotically-inducible protein OsmY